MIFRIWDPEDYGLEAPLQTTNTNDWKVMNKILSSKVVASALTLVMVLTVGILSTLNIHGPHKQLAKQTASPSVAGKSVQMQPVVAESQAEPAQPLLAESKAQAAAGCALTFVVDYWVGSGTAVNVYDKNNNYKYSVNYPDSNQHGLADGDFVTYDMGLYHCKDNVVGFAWGHFNYYWCDFGPISGPVSIPANVYKEKYQAVLVCACPLQGVGFLGAVQTIGSCF